MLRSALLAALLLACPAVSAQDDTPATLDDLYIDFAPPDLTAFTLVGVSASRVSRPGTLKGLAASLANGFSSGGLPQQGVGLELTPGLLIGGDREITHYTGAAERISLSVAALRTDDSTRVGIGLRWVPIDGADPLDRSNSTGDELRAALGGTLAASLARLDVLAGERRLSFAGRIGNFIDGLATRLGLSGEDYDALSTALSVGGDLSDLESAATSAQRASFEAALGRRALTGAEADTLGALLLEAARVRALLDTDELTRLNGEAEAIREAFRAEVWNATVLQFAVGTTWRTGGGLDAFESEGLQAFVGAAVGLDTWFQAIGHLRGQALADRSGLEVGARLLAGSATLRGSLEGAFATGDLAADGNRILLGGEFQLADGTFLELATGVNLPEVGPAGLLTLGGIRYALRPARRYEGPGR